MRNLPTAMALSVSIAGVSYVHRLLVPMPMARSGPAASNQAVAEPEKGGLCFMVDLRGKDSIRVRGPPPRPGGNKPQQGGALL